MSIELPKYLKAFTLFLILGLSNNVSAQVLHTESFDATTFLPAGWSSTGLTNYWSRRTNGTFPTVTPHSGAGLARYDSHVAAAGTAQTIITPVIDYSNLGNNVATFSLWLYRDSAKLAIGDSLSIFINTTASLTGATELGVIARSRTIALPDTVAAIGWYQYSFNIPISFNTNTNYILLTGTSQLGNNIFIDDVQWTAYPALCTGTPNPGTMSVNTPVICGGTGATTIALSGETTGFSGLTYVWESSSSLSGPWSVIDTAVTSIATGTITSTTYYKCVIGCSYSSASDSTSIDSVVISSNPVPVITVTPGQATYCSGGSPISLVASGAGLYTWSPATGLNSNIGDSVLASPTATTRYTVTGVDSLGCYGSATVNVNSRRSPAAAITATANQLCPGDSTTLTDTLTAFGNVVFAWTPGAETTAAITVAPDTTTTYYATVTAGGCSATDSMVVMVTPNPVAAFTYAAAGPVITFTNTSINSTAVKWTFNNGDTSVLQSPVYTYTGAGTDTVTLVAYGACANDTMKQVITVYNVGIKNVSGFEGLNVWPVPATGVANVEFVSLQQKAELRLMNDLGQVLETRYAIPASGNHFKEEFILNNLPSGIYVVRIIAGNSDVSVKMIKM